MAQKKESFFWTSYSDLMTSLFFVMLVLFVLVIVLLHKRMEATESQLQAIKEITESTKDLDSSEYFQFRPEYKKYQLTIEVKYPARQYELETMITDDKDLLLSQLADAGHEIKNFLDKHNNNQYLLIIEGQASLDGYKENYELSYLRAYALIKYWIKTCNIEFGKNCEIVISGSGDGQLPTNSIREENEKDNQRFLIHILPKNIFDNNESKK